jgi:hypothetical protein
MSLSVVIIGNTNHRLMEFALEKTIKAVPYSEVLVFCNEKLNLSVPYNFYKLPDKFGLTDYSRFCIKKLNKYVKTDYCMTIQYDGFAVNKHHWSDDFLKYDSIGPLISPNHPPMLSTLHNIRTKKSDAILKENQWRTGGGGFNIKSKKFLELCEKNDSITGMIPMHNNQQWICDDLELSYYYDELYEKNNIKLAPVDLTLNFAAEITTGYDHCLGFHGWYNTALFLNKNEIDFYMQNLKRSINDKEKGMFFGFLLSRNFVDLFEKYYKKTQGK